MTNENGSEKSATDAIARRQFCRTGIHACIPAVTLKFEGGRSLHFCTDHAGDADTYRIVAQK